MTKLPSRLRMAARLTDILPAFLIREADNARRRFEAAGDLLNCSLA